MAAPFIIVTVSGNKGGVGKTATVCAIAPELSEKFKTVVIDIDVQNHINTFNTNRKEKGFKPLKVIEVLSEDDLTKLAVDNNSPYELIIIDTGGFDIGINRHAALSADMIIAPLKMSGSSELSGLMSFREYMKEIREVNPIKAHILLNRLHPRDSSSHAEMKNYVNLTDEFQMLESTLRVSKHHDNMLFDGCTPVENQENEAVSNEVLMLVREITQIIKDQ